jgi:hypothetical protein
MTIMELLKINKAKIEDNRLVFDDNITVKEWEHVGGYLKAIETGIHFFIGDWACYGEKKGFIVHGVKSEMYDKLEKITGLKRSTIQVCKHVADRVESLLRINDLSYCR